jgi:hypothetical protein
MRFLYDPKTRFAFLIETQVHERGLILPEPGYRKSFAANRSHALFHGRLIVHGLRSEFGKLKLLCRLCLALRQGSKCRGFFRGFDQVRGRAQVQMLPHARYPTGWSRLRLPIGRGGGKSRT